VDVLVVDPSGAVRSRLVSRLRDVGLAVDGEADTAADALRIARSLTLDAIVLDVLFPDRLGLELLRDLRLHAPGAIIVILTNATHYRKRCLDGGADHFLDKSSEFDQVVPTLAVSSTR
jgi:DNA-binding response OmpR family regulator